MRLQEVLQWQRLELFEQYTVFHVVLATLAVSFLVRRFSCFFFMIYNFCFIHIFTSALYIHEQIYVCIFGKRLLYLLQTLPFDVDVGVDVTTYEWTMLVLLIRHSGWMPSHQGGVWRLLTITAYFRNLLQLFLFFNFC